MDDSERHDSADAVAAEDQLAHEPLSEGASRSTHMPSAVRVVWRAALPVSLALLVALVAIAAVPSLRRRTGIFPGPAPTPTFTLIQPSFKQLATPASQAQWDTLASRPLQLPTLQPGDTCPTVPGQNLNNGMGLAQGHNPVFVAGMGPDDVLPYLPPSAPGFQSNVWGGNKVVWGIGPNYLGPLLVRGARVDGPGTVGFNGGLDDQAYPDYATAPVLQYLRLYPDDPNSTWNFSVGYTRLQAPGCYALQVDGLSFTEIIVFAARPAS